MKQDMSMIESVSPLGKLRPASPRIAPLVDLTEELQTIMGGGINSPAGTKNGVNVLNDSSVGCQST